VSQPSPPPLEATRSTKPAWVALLLAPLLLALPFIPVVAFFGGVRGLEGDALFAAVERAAALPSSMGFGLILLLTWRLARRDGLSFAALGWRHPPALAFGLGLGVGLVLLLANDLWFYGWVQAFQPSFDPAARSVPLLWLVPMLLVAIVAEETLYRGYALQRLQARHGPALALVVTSVGYALLTPGLDVALKLWALGFGALLAGLRLWRDSLWPVAIAHAIVSLGPRLLLAAEPI
jgi:membrane protease YdiL (CAAX protease family)